MTDQTRRHWLIRITQATAGVGLAEKLSGSGVDDTALPPGVYQGSTAHLSHALMSSDRYHFIPPGCPTEYIRPSIGPFQPQHFSDVDFSIIRRLIRLLLGEDSDVTDSVQETAEWIDLRVSSAAGVRTAATQLNPLYRILAVADYGIGRVKQRETEDPGKTCREGLEWLRSKDFASLSIEAQTALLHSISDKKTENAGTRLFDLLKTETIKGFYTSRAGLKELDFKGNAFYARSPGCST